MRGKVNSKKVTPTLFTFKLSCTVYQTYAQSLKGSSRECHLQHLGEN